jgi:RimJ/RimL family protein N-acetyltransferase
MAFRSPFKAEHLEYMRVQKGEPEEIAGIPGVSSTLCSLGAKSIIAEDGTVLGIIGLVPTLPGACEVFILASEDQGAHSIGFARGVLKELLEIKPKYRRIQAVTSIDNLTHQRFIEWLGFVREGVLKKYGLKGNDMVMWGLT